MPRIIKYNYVNISEDAHTIDVPNKDVFAKHVPGDSEDELEEPEEISPDELLQIAEERAETIIENARKKAEELVADAKEQAKHEGKAILEDAKKTGYAEGRAKAESEGRAIIAEAENTLLSAREEKERLLMEAEPEIVSVIIDIIDKLAGDIAWLNPAVILHLVKTGLHGAPDATELSVRVSAADFDTVLEAQDEIASVVDSDMKLTFIKDASLTQGGCVIDTPIGSVDSSLGTQWSALKKDLIMILKGR